MELGRGENHLNVNHYLEYFVLIRQIEWPVFSINGIFLLLESLNDLCYTNEVLVFKVFLPCKFTPTLQLFVLLIQTNECSNNDILFQSKEFSKTAHLSKATPTKIKHYE